MLRNSFGEFYGRHLKALGGASIYDNIVYILMRTNLFVFNSRRKSRINYSTHSTIITLLLQGILNTLKVKKKPFVRDVRVQKSN